VVGFRSSSVRRHLQLGGYIHGYLGRIVVNEMPNLGSKRGLAS